MIDYHLTYLFQLAKVTDFFQQLDKFRKEQIGSVKVIHESMKLTKNFMKWTFKNKHVIADIIIYLLFGYKFSLQLQWIFLPENENEI